MAKVQHTANTIHAAMDKAEKSAWKRAHSMIVMKGAKHVATIKIAYPADGAGTLRAFVADWTAKPPEGDKGTWTRWQMGVAGGYGYGYDKTTAALSHMVIDGHELNDHCGVSLKYPKGHNCFPAGFKPPRGYRLANRVSKGPRENYTGSEHYTADGHSSCYRESGLGYLRALGYTIIEA